MIAFLKLERKVKMHVKPCQRVILSRLKFDFVLASPHFVDGIQRAPNSRRHPVDRPMVVFKWVECLVEGVSIYISQTCMDGRAAIHTRH